MPHSHEIIKAYIERLLALKDELKEEDLRPLAQDLGLSESDWQHLQNEVEDHVIRGQGFLGLDNWVDALAEYQEALALNPFNQGALEGMLESHLLAWEKTAQPDHQQASENFARKLLEEDPRHEYALEVISEFREVNKRENASFMVKPVSEAFIADSNHALGASSVNQLEESIPADQPDESSAEWETTLGKVTFVFVGFLMLLAFAATLNSDPPLPEVELLVPEPKVVSWSIMMMNDDGIASTNIFDTNWAFVSQENADRYHLKVEESILQTSEQGYTYQLSGSYLTDPSLSEGLAIQIRCQTANGESLFQLTETLLPKGVPAVASGLRIPFSLSVTADTLLPTANFNIIVEGLPDAEEPAHFSKRKKIPFSHLAGWEGKPALAITQIKRRIEPVNDSIRHDRLTLELVNLGETPIRSLSVQLLWLVDGTDEYVSEAVPILDKDGQPLRSGEQVILSHTFPIITPPRANIYDYEVLAYEVLYD
ncbi:MAG: hypothetical protein AAFR61_20140 [Bacteroidota bacterium]